MNPFLPAVKARDVVRVAKKLGFEFDRQSGSHAVYYPKPISVGSSSQSILPRILNRRPYSALSKIWGLNLSTSKG